MSDKPPRPATPLILFASAAVAIAAAIAYVARPSADSLLQDAVSALRAKDFAAARALADRSLQLNPASAPAAFVAASAAEQLDDIPAALELYDRIPDDAPDVAATARVKAGELHFKQRNLAAAASQLERAIRLDPDNLVAHDRLAYIDTLSGRDWELISHQIAMLRLGEINATRLYALSLGDRLPTDPTVIRDFALQAPDDPLIIAGQSLIDLANQRRADAAAGLQRALELNPDLTALRLRLGMLHLNGGPDEELAAWHASLPDDALDYPQLWVIRGLYARRTNQPDAAIRCFWEALRRDPNHQQANYQLGQLLAARQRTADAQPFLDRARQLEDYVHAVFASTFADARHPTTARSYRRCAEQAQQLGLAWEAWAWQTLAIRGAAGPQGAPFQSQREIERPSSELTARCSPEANPALKLDFSDSPLPEWDSAPTSPAAQPPASSVSFADVAQELGITFSYVDATDPASDGKRIFDSIGGGVAILDFDLDSRPDLYATQRCPWPPDPQHGVHVDALYRNLNGRQFSDAAQVAGIAENGYSQGATVGDFNADGFPDIYVANMGANRFFMNCGDGTFADVTEQTGVAGDDWSTSCLLADLSGDSLPDLYVVNYVEINDDIERVCRAPDGSSTTCPPGGFRAAADRLYLNRGDGTFDDVSRDAGVRAAEGRGLGIVAADLHESGRLSLFVANDQDPNFLFVDHSGAPGTPRFADEALANGVALSGDGRAQAGMGVAAGDANGDGRLDLYLTTFTGEPNTLFTGLGGGLFADGTGPAQLVEPSLQMLGFGTQFLDADLDADLDLIVANGHIDDRSSRGELYRMPPQFEENLGGGRFAEQSPDSLGPYFSGRYLGRGLARLDWNRDGLDDVAISHLDAPLALLTNTTASHGRFISIRLVGTDSSREGIGATVTVIAGDRTLVHQLTAGDGFHASNERALNIGLGAQSQPVELHVRWPSGVEQTASGIEVDRHYMLVEGRASAPLTNDH